MLGVPHRCLRQLHQFLRHVMVRSRAHAGDQCGALAPVEILAEHRLDAQLRKRRLDHQLVQLLDRVFERRLLAAPPGGERWHGQFLAQQASAQTGQKAEQGARFEQVRTERIGDQHIALTGRFDQTGYADRRFAIQLQRVAEVVVEPAQDHVHPTQAGQVLQPDTAVAHHQVGAFDQRKSQVARQIGVLEIGFVVGPRGQQHDQRRAIALRRVLRQRVAQRGEEAGQVLDAQVAELFRKDA